MLTLFPNDAAKGYSQLLVALYGTIRLLMSTRTVSKDIKHVSLLEVARVNRGSLATDPKDKVRYFLPFPFQSEGRQRSQDNILRAWLPPESCRDLMLPQG